MFFAVVARDKPGMSQVRAETKPRHAEHLDGGAPALRVLQSGPLLSPDGRECGSLLVVEAETAGAVEAFLGADPYVKAGLFAAVEVHPWLWRRGNPFIQPPEGPAP